MSKTAAYLMMIYVLSVILFGTWQMFLGNLEAAFSSFPFLLIAYIFAKNLRNRQPDRNK